MREIELKFLLDEPAAIVWARLRKLGAAAGARTSGTLRSIYFDSPDLDLRKAGIALRIRRDGRRWIQTVKTARAWSGALVRVGEFEIDAPEGRLRLDAIPDDAVRVLVLRLVGQAAIAPVCETVIRRSRQDVSVGDTRAEVAVDIGAIHAGGRSADLREVEVELLSGSASGLFEIARALFVPGGLRFSRLSKSERGYLLAEKGYIELPAAPRTAREVAVAPAQSVAACMRNMLRECADQVSTNIETICKADDLEGPHQLRIGLRRLRCVLAVCAQVANGPELERLDGEARWLGQEVGRLRDLDVAATEIVGREAVLQVEESGLAALAEELQRRACEERRRLRHILNGCRVRSLVLDLLCFAETRGWQAPEDLEQTGRLAAPVAAVAKKSLKKHWAKVKKLSRSMDALTLEERHELRKALKKLRYAIEFFAPLYKRRHVTPVIARLKRLQDVFGVVNDAEMLKRLLDQAGIASGEDAARQRAVGWILGAGGARAQLSWTRAREQWQDLKRTPRFWK